MTGVRLVVDRTCVVCGRHMQAGTKLTRVEGDKWKHFSRCPTKQEIIMKPLRSKLIRSDINSIATKRPGHRNNNRRRIISISEDGVETEYESVSEACYYINGHPANIISAARGKTKQAYGLKWKYAE